MKHAVQYLPFLVQFLHGYGSTVQIPRSLLQTCAISLARILDRLPVLVTHLFVLTMMACSGEHGTIIMHTEPFLARCTAETQVLYWILYYTHRPVRFAWNDRCPYRIGRYWFGPGVASRVSPAARASCWSSRVPNVFDLNALVPRPPPWAGNAAIDTISYAPGPGKTVSRRPTRLSSRFGGRTTLQGTSSRR